MKYFVVMMSEGLVVGKRWFDTLPDATRFARECPLDTLVYNVLDQGNDSHCSETSDEKYWH